MKRRGFLQVLAGIVGSAAVPTLPANNGRLLPVGNKPLSGVVLSERVAGRTVLYNVTPVSGSGYTKALWPGVNAWFKDVYDQRGGEQDG